MESREYDGEGEEHAEIILFQVPECYVYKIPPRKSSASYRADEWDINKWTWEGSLRVVSKGEACRILLVDTKTGELFSQTPVRKNEPLPVEAVIDSSRFFVLRIEDQSGDTKRHAFVGLGFRERPEAYDFQAALHDHVQYLNRKKEAEIMELAYQSKPAADYSLKDGETIHIDIKKSLKSGSSGAGFLRKKVEELKGQNSPVSLNQLSNLLIPPFAPPPLSTTTLSLDEKPGNQSQEDDFGDFQAA